MLKADKGKKTIILNRTQYEHEIIIERFKKQIGIQLAAFESLVNNMVKEWMLKNHINDEQELIRRRTTV